MVLAAPESIKSLALKFVEQLHAVDSFRENHGKSKRESEIEGAIKERMQAKSDMADELVHVLRLWKEGVLVMDEVDVLLHPLKSELNFPIGSKYPIDMHGYRWDLPIFLIGQLFEDTPMRRAMKKGIASRAIQQSPHPVLLDPSWYAEEMLGLVADASLQWCSLSFFFVFFFFFFFFFVCVFILICEICERGQRRSWKRRKQDKKGLKLLNLAADWTTTLMPHVLAKIDRVTFGLLTREDLAAAPPDMPASRRVTAVPFVGKDVPSRASEFAHPDILIGLTILAYRYSGLRLSDMRRIVVGLKHDYARQVGPRAERPAAVLFRQWLEREGAVAAVLPLPLFQPGDARQLARLHGLLRLSPPVIHHWLCDHVFPSTMNFQKLKISACGHALGSDMLFGRRVGFSGTPSSLLPLDLGECQYEPGSEGKIVHTLTNPEVVDIVEVEACGLRDPCYRACKGRTRSSTLARSSLAWTISRLRSFYFSLCSTHSNSMVSCTLTAMTAR